MPNPYPPEFRARVLALLRAGKKVQQVAQELNLSDGTLSAHSVGSDPASDQVVAQGTDASFIPTTGPGAIGHLQWYSTTTQSVAFAGSSSTAPVDVVSDPSPPLTSLDLDGVRYFQIDGNVVASIGGRISATDALPTLQPDPLAGGFPPGYKGVYTGVSAGQVSALVPTPSGDVLAFSSTGLASAVTNLMTGKTTAIPGYGSLGGATRTASGSYVALAWRAQQQSYPIQVLLLDGSTLSVASSTDTGVSPTGYLHDRVLGGASHDAVVSIARGDEIVGVGLTVLAVDRGKVSTAVNLPNGSGLDIAAGSSSSVFVFGGPAGNKVGQLDLVSGSFTPDVPELRAPAGSFVVGISTG